MHTILCLNGGSSSLKFAVYRLDKNAEQRICHGAVEAVGNHHQGKAWLWNSNAIQSVQTGVFPDHRSAVDWMFSALQQQGIGTLAAAGHRIVHGGPHFSEPRLIHAAFRRDLETLVPFAPLHLPGALALIDAAQERYPELPQVACFDTAFHDLMPEVAKRFALPNELWEKGIRRYGFHGLSYEYVVGKLGKQLGLRTIIAHLGNGASMVALKNGEPIDTSMGLTPLGGFMMGTRSGDLDPGILLYLSRTGYNEKALEDLLNHHAGLLGVSGSSADMKVLLERRETDSAAAMAVTMFCYQIRKFIGAFAAALGGLDMLVFTGGIGERAAPVRAEICSGLEHLGVDIDKNANALHAGIISRAGAKCVVRMVQTNEDLMIARKTSEIIFGNR